MDVKLDAKFPHLVTKIKDIKGLTMLVEFDGKDTRAIDLSRLVSQRATFRRLKDPKVFLQYEITKAGGICWSRDLEITGPTLYHMGDDSDIGAL